MAPPHPTDRDSHPNRTRRLLRYQMMSHRKRICMGATYTLPHLFIMGATYRIVELITKALDGWPRVV